MIISVNSSFDFEHIKLLWTMQSILIYGPPLKNKIKNTIQDQSQK